MNITVVNVAEQDIFEGAEVINIQSGQRRIVRVLPKGKTISEAIRDGEFNPSTDIDFDTFILNKSRFKLA